MSLAAPSHPPEVLGGYNEVLANGAERIMVMAEKQNDHRIRQEGKVIAEDIRRQKWGLGLGFFVALLGLAAASYISRLCVRLDWGSSGDIRSR